MKEVLLCSVYDKKGKLFGPVMTFNNEVEAVRAFQLSCEKNEMIKKWPEDFEMILLGTLEQETGILRRLDDVGAKTLACASSFVLPAKDNQQK